jgi:hypothetical protein
MFNNFLVTGYGRSGTKWLAKMLDQIPLWDVKHEPGGAMNMNTSVEAVNFRFSRDLYGEVNSYLRGHARKLRVRRMGLIIRDPKDIWTSMMARKPRKEWARHAMDLMKSYENFVILSDVYPAKPIIFERIIEDSAYYVQVAKYLTRQKQIEVPEDFYIPVNQSREKPDYEDTPRGSLETIERARRAYSALINSERV